jgi:hypothetical protein
MSRPTIEVSSFAQLREAKVTFGDLTLLVGPQATGKSLVLQLLKLAVDSSRLAGTLRQRGFGWSSRRDFCAVYFGEGMEEAWREETSVRFSGKPVPAPPPRSSSDPPRLFYIPAHRTLSIAEGWPAGFRSYKPDTPFVVRDFSERLLDLLTTRGGTEGNVVFPLRRRLKQGFREVIDEAVFHGGQLKLLSDGPRRQFKLVYGEAGASPRADIAYMAWTAGQREFIPLLLGIYHLVPLGARRRVEPIRWVVIEEPEMGLHARAVQAVMLLILELMDRGYRVAISTHSPAILELVWALRELQARKADPRRAMSIFGVEGARWDIDKLAQRTLRRQFKVFYLRYDGASVVSRDISTLDPGADDIDERTWGDLLTVSERANEAVAEAEAEAG